MFNRHDVHQQSLESVQQLHLAHTAAGICVKVYFVDVEVLLYVHRNRKLITDGSPGRPLRLSHSS